MKILFIILSIIFLINIVNGQQYSRNTIELLEQEPTGESINAPGKLERPIIKEAGEDDDESVAGKLGPEPSMGNTDPLEISPDLKKKKEMIDAKKSIDDAIMDKVRQVKEEEDWVQQVEEILKSYTDKVAKVEKNILGLKGNVKKLSIQKKKIENQLLQMELKKKLEAASTDLSDIKKAIGHVQSKQDSFSSAKDGVESTISNLQKALAKLQNEGDKTEGVKEEAKAEEQEAEKEEEEALEKEKESGEEKEE